MYFILLQLDMWIVPAEPSDGGQQGGLHNLNTLIEYSQTGLAERNAISSGSVCCIHLLQRSAIAIIAQE